MTSVLDIVAIRIRSFEDIATALAPVHQVAPPGVLEGIGVALVAVVLAAVALAWATVRSRQPQRGPVSGALSEPRLPPGPSGAARMPVEEVVGSAPLPSAPPAPVVAPVAAPAVARAEPAPGLGGILGGLRSRIDEVEYAPGQPNVLSLTKYAPEAAREPADGVGIAGEIRWSRADDGDRTVVVLVGVLDALAVPELRQTFDAIVAEGRRSVIIELSGVRHLDSTGVAAIVGLLKRCRAYGGAVRVEGARGQPLAVLKLLRLDQVLALA